MAVRSCPVNTWAKGYRQVTGPRQTSTDAQHGRAFVRLRPMRNALLCLALLVGLSACSSSTSPADANVSGTWSGNSSNSFGVGTFTATISQSSQTLSGTWSGVFNDSRLNNSGTLSGAKTGSSVQVTLLSSSPANCPYAFTGTLSTTTSITGTYATFNCTIPIGGSLTLTKH